MMLKNEEKRLRTTLDSVVGGVDSLVIYDTGSTDRTAEILKEFCAEHDMPLHVKEGEFTDFSTSRNVALAFADEFPEIDFVLLMDCNDELRGGDALREFCRVQNKTDETAWLVMQEWYSGVCNQYYNIRLLKPRRTWRYHGVVHEWIKKEDEGDDYYIHHKAPAPICLFQDRTQDDDKTGKRFYRDKELLLVEHENNPEDGRTVFYLAQTCSCLGQKKDAYYWYGVRAKMMGFYEEGFHCHLRRGEIALKRIEAPVEEDDDEETVFLKSLTWEDTLGHFMKAFEHTPRAEPVTSIAEHYRAQEKWLLAFHFARIACELPYPDGVLFIDNHVYDYTRWHVMGIVAFYAGYIPEGLAACQHAIARADQEIDRNNLAFYKDAVKKHDKEQKKLKKKERGSVKVAGQRRGR